MMKRLMHGEKVIGDYPDEWGPPEKCDMSEGLKAGSMTYVESPPEPEPPKAMSLIDLLIANPEELAKLKKALA